MALSVAAGVFSVGSTVDATLTVNTVGFQPKFTIFFGMLFTSATMNTFARGNIQHGYGVAKSSTECFASCQRILDGTASADYSEGNFVAAYVMKGASNTTPIILLNAYTPTSSGFTVVADELVSAAFDVQVGYICFGGDDIEVGYCGYISAATSTGNASYVLGSGQCTAAHFWGSMATTALPPTMAGANLRNFVGYATSTAQRCAAYGGVDGASTMDTYRFLGSDRCIFMTGATDLVQASFTSFDADGITLNFSVVSSAFHFGCLLLRGNVQFDLRTVQAKTGTTGTVAETGVGFQPSALLTSGVASSLVGSKGVSGSMVMGLATATAYFATTQMDMDAQASATISRGEYTDRFIVNLEPSGTATIDSYATVSAWGSDGYTLDWQAVDALDSCASIVLAVGPAAVVSGSNIPVKDNSFRRRRAA